MSTLKTNTLTGTTSAGSILVTGEGGSTTTNLQQGLVKVWINFNGTGTITTRDSNNVTSITDQGTGLTDITIANDMGNSDYAPSGVCGETSGTEMWEITSRAAGVLRVQTHKSDNGSAIDATVCSVTINGDLA